MRNLLVSLLVVVSSANADMLLGRMDASTGRESGYTFGYCHDVGKGGSLEAWTFAQPNFPIYEVGYSHYLPLSGKTGVLACGYVSYWSKVDQWFAEPAAILLSRVGDLKLKAFWGAYAPLNGGAWQLYCNPTSLMAPVTRRLDLGVATTCWFAEGAKPTFGVGPTASLKIGSDLTLGAWALMGVNQPDTVRLEAKLTF